MWLVGNLNYFHQTFSVWEILGLKVEKVIFRKRKEVQICRRFLYLHQEEVEQFEFCKKHIAGNYIIFISLKFQSRTPTGTGSIQGGLGVQVQGVWGRHLARVKPRQRGLPIADRNLP